MEGIRPHACNCWQDLGGCDQLLQLLRVEIGDANGPQKTLLHSLLQAPPRIDEAAQRPHRTPRWAVLTVASWKVKQHQVNIALPTFSKLGHSSLDGTPGFQIPKICWVNFGDDEDVRARQRATRQGFPNSWLVIAKALSVSWLSRSV